MEIVSGKEEEMPPLPPGHELGRYFVPSLAFGT